MTMLLLFLSLLPVILLLVYIYNTDNKKEPLKLLIQLFLLGMLSSVLVILISKGVNLIIPSLNKKLTDYSFLELLFYAFIRVALIEELCKWIMLVFRGYNNKEFDEIYDIIVYAVFVALGFALVENLAYVFSRSSLRAAILRALLSVPGHACNAIFMGYYLGIAKRFHYNKQFKLEKKYIIFSILVPTLLHGMYDFCLMSKLKILIFVFVLFIALLYMKSFTTVKEVSLDRKNLVSKHRFCKSCGYKIDGDICPKCGLKQDSKE